MPLEFSKLRATPTCRLPVRTTWRSPTASRVLREHRLRNSQCQVPRLRRHLNARPRPAHVHVFRLLVDVSGLRVRRLVQVDIARENSVQVIENTEVLRGCGCCNYIICSQSGGQHATSRQAHQGDNICEINRNERGHSHPLSCLPCHRRLRPNHSSKPGHPCAEQRGAVRWCRS